MNLTNSPYRVPRPCTGRIAAHRGSALVMVVILTVILTSLIMVIAWSSTNLAQAGSSLVKSDQAYYAAEAGMQQAVWRFKHDNSWRADPNGSPATPLLTGSVTMGSSNPSYSVSCSGPSGGSVTITSTGTNGVTASTLTIHVGKVSPLPQTSVGLTFVQSGTLNVTGSIYAQANISLSSTGTINGDLQTAAKLTNGHEIVTGVQADHVANLPAPPDVLTIYNTLQAQAWQYNGPTPYTNVVLDFNAHPIIYFDTDVAWNNGNPTIIGSGTIVVEGKISISNKFPASGTARMNIVCKHDLSTTGTFNLTGGIYLVGGLTQSNTYTVNGVIALNGKVQNSGTGSYILGAPASFDPRGSGGGGRRRR